jgi:hypothetical protein
LSLDTMVICISQKKKGAGFPALVV